MNDAERDKMLDLIENNLNNIGFLTKIMKEHTDSHIKRDVQNMYALFVLCIVIVVFLVLNSHSMAEYHKTEQRVAVLEEKVQKLEAVLRK